MTSENYTELHEFLVSILGSVPYGIISIDMEGIITVCNTQALSHLNIQKENTQLVETPLLDYLSALPEVHQAIEDCVLQGRKPFDFEILPFDNKFLTIRGRRVLQGMIISIADITREQEQQQDNVLAMLQGQEAERRRLAREIHDGIGPTLSTIRLNVEALKSDMTTTTEKKVKAIENLLQTVTSDIRSISHALMPNALLDFGLVAALQNLCDRVNESGKVAVEFFHKGIQERLPQETELNLFRIIQELLNNAFKYAQADNITIQLIKYPEQIMLSVEDDGVGFDPNNLLNLIDKGIGLQNIETRVQSLAGTCDIETQPGKGVLTTIELPIKH